MKEPLIEQEDAGEHASRPWCHNHRLPGNITHKHALGVPPRGYPQRIIEMIHDAVFGAKTRWTR